MSKVIYVDINKSVNNYKVEEDTIFYQYDINRSSSVNIDIIKEGVSVYYYYGNINYDNNEFKIVVNHLANNTNSYVYIHGVNASNKQLHYWVDGVIPNEYSGCECNQDSQIINLSDGQSKIWPNLIIENFDGIANHSAYIGKFKEERIFYIMSRGISRENAYRLLLNGFLIFNDSIEKDKIDNFILEIEKL